MVRATRPSKNFGNYLGVHAGGIVICLVLVGLVYVFGYLPYSTEKLDLSQQRAEFDRLKSLQPRLIRENRELKDKYQQYTSVTESVPATSYSDGPILDLVSQMLLRRKAQLKNFTIRSDTLKDTTVDLQLAGEFESLARLLKDFEEMRSPAKILHLTMNSTSADGTRCSASLTVHFTKLSQRRTSGSNIVQHDRSPVEGAFNG